MLARLAPMLDDPRLFRRRTYGDAIAIGHKGKAALQALFAMDEAVYGAGLQFSTPASGD